MRTLTTTAMAALLMLAGCDGGPEPARPADPAKARLEGIIEAAKATGAVPYGEVLWYTRDNLYDYINGMAEEYLDAGFVGLAHSEWKAAGATAVMTAPPADKTAEVAPGVKAYRDEGFCEFGAGRYYVRLTARPDAEGQEALLDALARAVAEKASEDHR